MNSGKTRRMRRLGREGKYLIVPLDHGVSQGPIPGLENPPRLVENLRIGGATSIVVHKGLVGSVEPSLGEMGLILHLSASTDLNPDPNDKRIVGSPKEALRLGADAVSVHVNVGAETESQMIEDLGWVAGECERWGVPLLAMMYVRGKEIRNPTDPEKIRHAARIAWELGADLVKVPFTGQADSFRRVVEGVGIPVVVSGGPKMESRRDLFALVEEALRAGASGFSVGRNVFQDPRPDLLLRDLAGVLFEGKSAKEVLG